MMGISEFEVVVVVVVVVVMNRGGDDPIYVLGDL